ncbi:ABC transporter ATP-binding protein [Chromobacterium violaceum]|uniref:Fe(3+) ions import ATP-binding protein FbpC n=1 Tax=Chromobacterium violaceum TaxID=536 RepID=A0AAX2MAC2_CHRVL|nr:ABC transporter ATP-binding protein [Chromobacterium violaceum]MCD0493271.1 ABC transporter ATP-binding protein [Chromobacterium violaceum]OLZ71962.1 ABC transporter ATP-binding protein [Chromobacterium violaceum]STB70830.1 Fe(3+) ions import ATP-binding protein FbpC [Chromobacterium violaceum]SUX32961.1 Fe(3+) ions import ATP-binding protein FbpC [Chromobacterium violaceum]
MDKTLEFDAVSLAFAGRPVLDGMSFALEAGEIACLLGGSGCGKTTALRCIAGFETPSAGRIRLEGETVFGVGAALPAHRRRVGMVFQDHALFPHLTVAANVAFGLSALRRAERKARVAETLRLVRLEEEAARYPHQLSGGQQQRVALARALAPRPRLLLLDEPFSNLDAELRERLAREVRAILQSQGISALMVTHDQHEAFAVADRVGVLHQGRLQQWDTPDALYHRPANRYVAGFIGQGVFLPGRVSGRAVMLETGELRAEDELGFADGAEVEVLLRPDAVQPEPGSPLRARVVDRVLRGTVSHYALELLSGRRLLAELGHGQPLQVGDMVGIRLQPRPLLAFARG